MCQTLWIKQHVRDSLSSVATFTASGEKDVTTAITSATKSSNSRKVMQLVGGVRKGLFEKNTKTLPKKY